MLCTFHGDTVDVHSSLDPSSRVQKGAGHETSMLVEIPIRAHQLGRGAWEEAMSSWIPSTIRIILGDLAPYPSGFAGIFLVLIRAGVSRVVQESLHRLKGKEKLVN